MKNYLFGIFILLGLQSFSQGLTNCEEISLKSAETMKEAEPCIKQLSEFALTEPMIGTSDEGHFARKVVYNWVEKTPDHTYSLNSNMMKIFKDDNLLLFTTWVCCLANASLTKETDFEKYALELMVKYILNSKNKVVIDKKVKKLLADWDSGTIDKYLD